MTPIDPLRQARLLEPHWYALRTRARAEKQVELFLERAGFETFLPLLEEDRQWADRTKRVAFPLFSGYTFARFRLGEMSRVVRTPGLFLVVSERGAPVPVREEELAAVRCLAQGVAVTGEPPEPVDWLAPGTPVEVVEGPFRGLRGFLVEVRSRSRVAVRLEAIRMALSVELDRGSLREVA